jgi:uncharacterized membrane protein YfcA
LILPHLALWQWLLGGGAAFLVGVAKTGVPGLGILVVPLFVLTVGDARHAAGWLLPLLSAADILAVRIYRRHAEARRLFSLAPWVLAGMAAGAVALKAPERPLRRLVGVLVLAMMAFQAYRRRRAEAPASDGREPRLHVVGYGVVAGFATTVANAAGPVMNAYLLAKRLPKAEFVATGAWFFLVINLMKLPVYGYHRLIDATSLAFDAALVPAVVAGALLGRALFLRIGQRAFDVAVMVLTAAGALLLLR